MNGWKYYKSTLIPSSAPHEAVNTDYIFDGSVWKKHPEVLLARWTTDYDCGYETNWWYEIKDEPFDISKLSSKYRYKINKGTKQFDVHKINPSEYKDELYRVQVAAYSAYPAKYRPHVDYKSFIDSTEKWNVYTTYGVFNKEDNLLVGYSLLETNGNCINYSVHKTNPEYEKKQVNAALIYKVLLEYDEFLRDGGYICDGARNISHETSFHEYLEKYFGFRKAYCKLHIAYNPKIKWAVKLLYPFRKILRRFDFIGRVHQINSVLKMQELVREGQKF